MISGRFHRLSILVRRQHVNSYTWWIRVDEAYLLKLAFTTGGALYWYSCEIRDNLKISDVPVANHDYE